MCIQNKNKKHKTFIVMILVILVTIMAITVFYWLLSLRLLFAYEVRVRFSSMPETDNELEEWLLAQPGVTKGVVSRNGQELHINYVIKQNFMRADPSTPNVESALERMGYQGTHDYRESRELYSRD
jgi:hypothetical protein